MIVVDTSAILGVLAGRPGMSTLRERIRGDGDLHAPHLLDVEFLHGVRRLIITGAISEDRAADTLHDFSDLTIQRYPHEALVERLWELRHNVTSYDAAFIALAEALDAPLVTCDARLARAPGHAARVELFTSA